jgi:hypothetical protein
MIRRTDSAAADDEGHHLVDLRPALHALLHQGGAAVAGTHMAAWPEQHGRLLVRTHHTFFDLKEITTN